MKKSYTIVKSLISAFGVFVYVFLVAELLFNAKNIFSDQPGILIPIFMLLLFVVSALITGLLVLGKPIHLYMNGLKKEAFTLIFSTLGWLVLFLIVVAVVLFLQ